MTETDCLFCRIVAGDIPGDVVYSNDQVVAFRDVAPQAPTHVLVVPRKHVANMAELVAAEPESVTDVMTAAVTVAQQEELTEGYRLVANTGREGGQTVDHLHVHVLGGRSLGWPPG